MSVNNGIHMDTANRTSLFKGAACLLSVALLSGCSWFGGDEADDGELQPAELVDFDAEVEIDRIWSSDVGASEEEYLDSLRPVVSGGVVYAASGEGDVNAFDAQNGDRLWRVEIDTELSGGVGVGAGAVFVGDRDGMLFAINTTDGVQLWTAQLSSELLSPASSDGDLVVVKSQDGNIFGLEASTGEQRWRYNTDNPVLTLYGSSSPLIVKRTVVAASAAGKIAGLDARDGSLQWETRLTVPRGRTELEKLSDIDGDLVVDGEIIYVAGYQGAIAAISRSSGRTLWTQKSSSHRGPALADNRVYVVEAGDQVRALRSNGGQELWLNDSLSLRGLTNPVAFGGYVAVADSLGYLHVMSTEDGRFVARTKVDGSGVWVPMTSDGNTLYVQDRDGDVSAYRIEAR